MDRFVSLMGPIGQTKQMLSDDQKNVLAASRGEFTDGLTKQVFEAALPFDELIFVTDDIGNNILHNLILYPDNKRAKIFSTVMGNSLRGHNVYNVLSQQRNAFRLAPFDLIGAFQEELNRLERIITNGINAQKIDEDSEAVLQSIRQMFRVPANRPLSRGQIAVAATRGYNPNNPSRRELQSIINNMRLRATVFSEVPNANVSESIRSLTKDVIQMTTKPATAKQYESASNTLVAFNNQVMESASILFPELRLKDANVRSIITGRGQTQGRFKSRRRL